MVSTRTKSSYTPTVSARSAYNTSLSRKSTYKSASRYSLDTSSTSRVSDTTTRFKSFWETWYDAFAAEVKDESPEYTSTQRRQEAESRWARFASKSLRCSDTDVRTWLSSSSPRTVTY